MTRKSNPWFTDQVRYQKGLLRKIEWTYHRSKTDAAWLNFEKKKQKQIYSNMLNNAKTNALSDKVVECGKDAKKAIQNC